MENILKGKVAIVTGGGRGVGAEICSVCAQEGASVAVVDINEDTAQATAQKIINAGYKAIAIKTDILDSQQVEKMVATVKGNFGPVDILINNAGYGVRKKFSDTTADDWSRDIGINIYGVLICTKAVIGEMIEKKYGKIVTIVSDAGRVGEPLLPVYSAAKAGAIGFSRALAKDVGKNGINVNCVALSAIKTELIADRLTPEREAKMIKVYPMRRLGQPQDVAHIVAFLSSDLASFITGQVIPVNGGYATGS
jgi:NAD(P)-dependent dehydrogenase (short-subunit alcohol dehydrogenase family)